MIKTMIKKCKVLKVNLIDAKTVLSETYELIATHLFQIFANPFFH